jgi:predicted GNAT family acetyltransferase
METDLNSISVKKNEKRKRFEIMVDGYPAFITYEEYGDLVSLLHTEVAPPLEGKGVASVLVEKTLAYLDQHGKKIFPYCPYVAQYIKRHPAWKSLVDEQFPGYESL